MNRQAARSVLMIEPTRFGFNAEAALTNSFQQQADISANRVQHAAWREFRRFTEQLEAHGVEVHIFQDSDPSTSPDSIFPNNWFSTHHSGHLVVYPMAVPNRRSERREDILQFLLRRGYTLDDQRGHEEQGRYLEGTGSLVFDHNSRVVYAAVSPRTSSQLVCEIADRLGYTPHVFRSFGKAGEPIYHTNVMMHIGEDYVAIGLDTVAETDQPALTECLSLSGKRIIPLSNTQVYSHFAGNMLQLQNQKGERILVLSESAMQVLHPAQLAALRQGNEHMLAVAIPTIEQIGGGSVRCMLAELF